jgi:two-component system chemotaxis response regulator CheY
MHTVFIVDDSPIVRRLLKEGILASQLGCEEASNGEDALNKIKGGFKPDVIVTDLNMPKMDGLTLIKEIRKLPATRFLPIFVLTTEQSPEKQGVAKAAGATGWLVKPIGWDRLYLAMKQAVPGLR